MDAKVYLALFHKTDTGGKLFMLSADEPFKYQYDGKIKTSGTGPKSGVEIRMKRKEEPQIAARKRRLNKSEISPLWNRDEECQVLEG